MSKYRITKSVHKRPGDPANVTTFYVERRGLFSWYRIHINSVDNRDATFSSYEEAVEYIFKNGRYSYYQTQGDILNFNHYSYYV